MVDNELYGAERQAGYRKQLTHTGGESWSSG